MTAEDMVDASLAGLDLGEFATIPSLPDVADYAAYERARLVLLARISQRTSLPPATESRQRSKLA